ncbi:hypothetical protein WUBG_06569, partial [Wuchereria bancrofti]
SSHCNLFYRENLRLTTHYRDNCAAPFDLCPRRNYCPSKLFCRLSVGGRESALLMFVRDFAFRALNICAEKDFVYVKDHLDVQTVYTCYLF